MQRKATKQSRAANKQEKDFHKWAKEQDCACCGSSSGSILDHWKGSSKKLYDGITRVHVGHWLVIPLCQSCDSVKTNGSLKVFNEAFGNWLTMWCWLVSSSPFTPPLNVVNAVEQEINGS